MNISENEDVSTLLPYYVYALMDPITMQVFYVGKGSGARAQQHLLEVNSLLSSGEELTAAKHQKIHEIHAQGQEPLERVIGRFETEDEAFAVEAILIKWVYGFKNLTNAVQGHGSEFIREKGDWLQRADLDIPAPVRTNDGSYAKEKIDNLDALGAFALLRTIQRRLSEEGFEFRDFSANEDKPFSPGVSNGWLGVIVRIKHVDFMISFSKSCIPAISIANTEYSRSLDAQEQLAAIYSLKGAEFFVREPKNFTVKGQGRYRDFAAKPRFNQSNLDPLFALLHEFKSSD